MEEGLLILERVMNLGEAIEIRKGYRFERDYWSEEMLLILGEVNNLSRGYWFYKYFLGIYQ